MSSNIMVMTGPDKDFMTIRQKVIQWNQLQVILDKTHKQKLSQIIKWNRYVIFCDMKQNIP